MIYVMRSTTHYGWTIIVSVDQAERMFEDIRNIPLHIYNSLRDTSREVWLFGFDEDDISTALEHNVQKFKELIGRGENEIRLHNQENSEVIDLHRFIVEKNLDILLYCDMTRIYK